MKGIQKLIKKMENLQAFGSVGIQMVKKEKKAFIKTIKKVEIGMAGIQMVRKNIVLSLIMVELKAYILN